MPDVNSCNLSHTLWIPPEAGQDRAGRTSPTTERVCSLVLKYNTQSQKHSQIFSKHTTSDPESNNALTSHLFHYELGGLQPNLQPKAEQQF